MTSNADDSKARLQCGAPFDSLLNVFPSGTRDRWRAIASGELIERLIVLGACGPKPSDPQKGDWLRFLRAKKAAWESYLDAAFAAGMFEGSRGTELRRRFADHDSHNFRSAMSECMACWFFVARMKLPFRPVAVGRSHRQLDMQLLLAGRDIRVEVKAPFRSRPESGGWSGGEADKIAEAMKQANKQFADDTPNLLVIVPQLRVRMFPDRDDLIHAAYGCTRFVVPMGVNGVRTEHSHFEFAPRGHFLNPIRGNGFPGFRRISALICLEERTAYRFPPPYEIPWDGDNEAAFWRAFVKAHDLHESSENEAWIEHDVLVLHNPHAYHPLPTEPWDQFPQLVSDRGTMKWTDGQKVVL